MPTKLSCTLAFVLLAAGCGGGATPEAAAPPPAAGPAPAATPSAKAAEPAPDPDAKMEAQRDAFVAECTAKTGTFAKDYCHCAFDQFKEVFKGMDPDKTKPTDEQVEQVKTKTLAACTSKLPEPAIKASFVSSCGNSDARLNGYCECAWTSLRKTLSLGDFTTDLSGPRFDEAKKRMASECKGQMPEAVVKNAFVEACTKQSGDPKPCECMWKKVRTKYSAAEIAGGIADVKSVPVGECIGKTKKKKK